MSMADPSQKMPLLPDFEMNAFSGESEGLVVKYEPHLEGIRKSIRNCTAPS
jgi:hypothetical protein